MSTGLLCLSSEDNTNSGGVLTIWSMSKETQCLSLLKLRNKVSDTGVEPLLRLGLLLWIVNTEPQGLDAPGRRKSANTPNDAMVP